MTRDRPTLTIPRLLPEVDFPPYLYRPGKAPHPVHDKDGHMFGVEEEEILEPDPMDWMACKPYLYGVDLFNQGYYWEAHEAWEGVWFACGRVGTLADFFKALIQLTAAGVKIREGRTQSASRLAQGACRLLHQVRDDKETTATLMGLQLDELILFAESLIASPFPQNRKLKDGGDDCPVFEFILLPQSDYS